MTARVPNGSPLNWQTVTLPSLRTLTQRGANWTQVTARVQNAQQDGKHGLLGFELPAGDGGSLENVAETMRNLREVLAAAAPGAALIFRVDAAKSPAQAARDIDSAAAFCDAVVIVVDGSPASLWAVKAARRTAEDQPFFDLPIFAELPNPTQQLSEIDYHLAGATGFTKPPPAEYQRLWHRNAALLNGAVTLEDAGLPLPLEGSGTLEDESPLVLFQRLRAIGRVPLMAQAKEPVAKDVPEPVSFKLGDRISAATVARLEAIARAGGRIYLEGAPFLDEKGQPAPWKLTALVGATATQVAPKPANLVLEDPWFFGTGRGESVRVVQTVSIVLGASSLAAVAKTEKGSFVPTGPRAVAKLEDGSPGVIVNPLGKGEVVWCPFEIGAAVATFRSGSAPAPTSDSAKAA